MRSLNPFLGAAVEIARDAGGILREEYAKPPEIRYKGEVDIVTQADKRSEASRNRQGTWALAVCLSTLRLEFPPPGRSDRKSGRWCR